MNNKPTTNPIKELYDDINAQKEACRRLSKQFEGKAEAFEEVLQKINAMSDKIKKEFAEEIDAKLHPIFKDILESIENANKMKQNGELN